MIHKTRGIVFHTLRYSDSSIIATIYTEDFGRQSYMVKGAGSKKSPYIAGLFQPLNILSLDVYHKSSREIQKIKEARSIVPLTGIHGNIIKTTIGLFIAEVLYRTVREEESNPSLFSFLIHSIEFFDLCNKGTENFHLIFLIQLSKFLGFYLDDNYSESNCYFNIRKGSFEPPGTADLNMLDRVTSFNLYLILHTTYSELNSLEFSGNQRSQLLGKIINYYQMHMDGLASIKSLRVMQEIFE